MQRQLSYNYQQENTHLMGQNICPSINNIQLQPQLISSIHLKYKQQPYAYILQIMKLQSSFTSDPQILLKYQPFFKSLSSFYNNVPYHNITHAFDVMTACDKFLIDYKMKEQLNLTQQERIFVLIAAYAHDNGHQGLTNNFYINSQDELAIRYSNISPLQNMHSSNLLACFRLHNIQISSQHKKLMVSLILATDNKHHFQLLQKIKQYQKYINNKIIENLNESQQIKGLDKQVENKNNQLLLEMIIHTADLNPCTKPVSQYLKWNQKLYDEFKTQYMKQRELNLKNYSFNFDLKNQQYSFATQNLSFLNNMILPFFKQVSIIVPQFWTELNHSIQIRNHFQSKVKSLANKHKEPQSKQNLKSAK